MNYPYIYYWGNNEKRLTLKNRKCRILKVGKKNTIMIEFENGDKEFVSRRALRHKKPRLHPICSTKGVSSSVPEPGPLFSEERA